MVISARPLIRQKLFFFIFDAVLIIGAFTAAFYMRLGTFWRTDFLFSTYLVNAFIILPFWLTTLVWSDKYALIEKRWLELFRAISLSALAGTTLFVLVFFFRREVFFSRLIILYIFSCAVVFQLLSVWLEQKWEHFSVSRRKNIIRTLIIGTNRAAERMIVALQKSYSRSVPVAILAPFGGSVQNLSGVPVLGKLDALERITEEYCIGEIILCDGVEQTLNLLAFAESRFLHFRVCPEILGVFREQITPAIIGGKTVLSLNPSPLFGWGQFWKRIFDLCCVFLLTPFFLLASFALILRNGSFRILKKEERIGAAGKKFWLWRWRKRFFWNNLPHIWNVFSGEMSMIGPRPLSLSEWQKLPLHFQRRFLIRPGIIGLWQRKKGSDQKEHLETMMQNDISYIQNWSFWLDLKILWRVLF